MSNIVIQAENLGKKYVIGHQAENDRYVALRDVLVQNARRIWHVSKDLVQGRAIIQGETMEEVWALKNVSFDVKQGEVVGIIGRNGAGKSTLLKIFSRITEPTEGRVRIKGRLACLLEVGAGFHPELTGRENIFLNGAVLGMNREEIRGKFDEIVAFAEVEKFVDTPVKRYSSGMYLRLAFAVAAHLQPEILVVDEVLAVGDVEFQKKCLGKMHDVSREGRSILFVSHNLSAVCSLCDRVLLLDKGALLRDGTSQEVCDYYLTVNVNTHAKLPGSGRASGAQAEILALTFKDDREKVLSVLNVGQPITVSIRYSLKLAEKAQTLMVQFTTIDGQVVWTAETSPGLLSATVSPADEGEVSLRISQIALYPKAYFVGVGIMNYGVGPIVWDKCYRTITVVSNSTLPHQGHDPARLNNIVMDHAWLDMTQTTFSLNRRAE